MNARPWTPEDDAILRERYADTKTLELCALLGRPKMAIYKRAHKLGVHKSPEMVTTMRLQAKNDGRFKAGLVPWNKGKRCPNLASGATRFKPGQLPHNHKPLGHEMVNIDGYLMRKVRDDPTSRTGKTNYRAVHILLWEQHHGPVPDGHIIVFRNGDKTDIRLDNLEAITRGELMNRNSISTLPPELRGVIYAKAQLTRVINEKEKHEEQADRS